MISPAPEPFSPTGLSLGFVLPTAVSSSRTQKRAGLSKTAEPGDFHDLQKKASSDPKCCFMLNVSKNGIPFPT